MIMKFIARIFCLLSLVAFVTGAVAHSAGSAAMASAMITADVDMALGGDCEACDNPGDGVEGTACNFACTVSGMVAIQSITDGSAPKFTSAKLGLMSNQAGPSIAGPPGKQPPRI